MDRSAMVRRVAVMAAVVVVAVAMSAGSADARRVGAATESSVSALSVWGRLADIGGRIRGKLDFGKAGWGQFRLQSAKIQEARLRAR